MSPPYTLKTVLALTGGKPDRAIILGTLSLVIWTLLIVTTIKYGSLAMRGAQKIANDIGRFQPHQPLCAGENVNFIGGRQAGLRIALFPPPLMADDHGWREDQTAASRAP
jgi:hypothetical protein